MSGAQSGVRVEVEYQFKEYKAIVREFNPRAPKNKPRVVNPNLPWNQPWAERLILAVILRPIFWVKKARVGNCSFEFTDAGLSRTSKAHMMTRTWGQVAAVHRLTVAYLIELEEGGAMPVPYRAFRPDERAAFERLLQRCGCSDA
jgi:hypothetical protein